MPIARCVRVASAVALIPLLGAGPAGAFSLAKSLEYQTVTLASTGSDENAAAHPLPRPKPRIAGAGGARLTPPPPLVSREVAQSVRGALGHVFARRFDRALAAQQEMADPVAAKLIEFFYVRDASARAPHERIAAFLENNPDWPSRELIRKRYELALMIQNAPAADVVAAFEEREPLTTPGTIALATALSAEGYTERATGMARTLWRTGTLTEGEERLVKQRFGDVLRQADHKARMDRMLYAGEFNAAIRAAELAGEGAAELARARITVARNVGKADEALNAVPEALRSDPVYIYSRIQNLRRSDKRKEALELLLAAPTDPEVLVDPDAWALERRIACRQLIEDGDPKTAYRVMAAHSAEGVLERLESEWLAGWTALSFVGDPQAAVEHFTELNTIGNRPISVARATYWLGRAYEALGELDTALEHYEDAAGHPTTYYGQLAMNRIGETRMPKPYKPIHAAAARRHVQETEPGRAVRLLMQTGYDRVAAGLMMSMGESATDELTIVGVAEMAWQYDMADAAVYIGKQGLYTGRPTAAYGFTKQGIPDFTPLASAAEKAAVFAIARQESVFNPQAASHAGALGLMQLMPGTASATAKAYSVSYDKDRLTSDPAYNAMLGSAHVADLIDRYGDAYALVLAAYNAGPGRVTEWLERFGDPRTDLIDPIDWVELIPYSETRNYVQRVMEGLQVYRSWLGDSEDLLIAQDLRLTPSTTFIARRNQQPDEQADEPPFETLMGSTEPGRTSPSGPGDSPTGLGFAPTTGLGFGFGGGQ